MIEETAPPQFYWSWRKMTRQDEDKFSLFLTGMQAESTMYFSALSLREDAFQNSVSKRSPETFDGSPSQRQNVLSDKPVFTLKWMSAYTSIETEFLHTNH